MAITHEFLESIREKIGTRVERYLGVVTPTMIRQFAYASRDYNPLYLDEDYARSQGHATIIAPPNLLGSIVNWAEGAKTEDLYEDGNSVAVLPGITLGPGVRNMGGGEYNVFHKPVEAGTELRLSLELVSLTEKVSSKGGLIGVATIEDHFTEMDGTPVMTSTRTTLLR